MNAPPEINDGRPIGGPLAVEIARRADLLERRSRGSLDAEDSRRLDATTTRLTELVRSGSPSVRRVGMDTDPSLMRRLAPMEPVHPFSDPTDVDEIRSRSELSRHCYVLDNSALPGHPLNVVWVALVDSLPSGMDDVIGPAASTDDTDGARIAVFYSIWNIEPGLAGIPGGSSLLGLVTDRLRRERPDIGTFTTLSPIPGFRSWMRTRRPGVDAPEPVDDPEPQDLAGSCVEYLLTLDDRNLPIDAVARFHMRNGARLWRLVPGGDRSPRGQDRSWAMMVNYRYAPEDLEANRSALVDGRPAVGSTITDLLHERSRGD